MSQQLCGTDEGSSRALKSAMWHRNKTVGRLLAGFAVGGVITSLPWLVSKLDIEALWPINFVMLPGSVIALVFSAGNVHTYNLTLMLVSNVILYAAGVYFLLRSRDK